MSASKKFIKATEEFNTFEKSVPAPYFRRSFELNEKKTLKITIAVCGFYELWFNGKKITRGFLGPAINNTNYFIYYDEYEVEADAGENVIGVLLGNGFHNNLGAYLWHFDQATFRSAPLFSVCVAEKKGDRVILEADERFKTAPSPILSDNYRFGEYYDANYEIANWNQKGFDDSGWKNALPTVPPKGKLRLSDIEPIIEDYEIKPVSITKNGDGYIYDFGQCNAGICRLRIQGKKGQKIELRHADSLTPEGTVNLRQLCCRAVNWEHDKDIVHRDVYVCRGEGTEVFQPTFTYHGFRFVRVDGITEEQATEDLLTYLVYHTRLNTRGDFTCSDEVTTKLQEMTRRSFKANFYHFPTDCPHREKMGWLEDAVLSAEAYLLNFDPDRNWREWMVNIRRAQLENGAMPVMVPNVEGHSYNWGHGPVWPAWGDHILVYLPYFLYLYRGETDMIRDTADAISKYLRLLASFRNEKGLIESGLGDWVHVTIHKPKAPLVVVASVASMDMAYRAAQLFRILGNEEEAAYAQSEGDQYRKAIRENLIDFGTGLVEGNCQSCQALLLYYGVFEKSEERAALDRLLEMVHEADDHFDTGVLGAKALFDVLTKFGYGDLVFKMITRDDYPSFGNWIKRGATALWENFLPDRVNSMNHHFWGFISAWFIKYIAGIRLNPSENNVNEVEIHPTFISAINNASAYHLAPAGKITAAWERRGGEILLSVEIPAGMKAKAVLDRGFRFADGATEKEIVSGVYTVLPNA